MHPITRSLYPGRHQTHGLRCGHGRPCIQSKPPFHTQRRRLAKPNKKIKIELHKTKNKKWEITLRFFILNFSFGPRRERSTHCRRPKTVRIPTRSRPVHTKKIEVSSLGRVVDARGVKKAPYCRVGVKGKTYRVHRLGCEAFWGPPPAPGLQVDHKDGTQSNNHFENLEWVTLRVNTKRSYLVNKNRRSNAAKRSKPVYARKHQTNDEWAAHPSMNEAARKLNLNPWHISLVTRGKRNHTGGWEFKLKPQK